MEALRKQSEQGAKMGYTGKQVIHPLQIPVVQKAFLPSEQQVEWAKGLLEAFDSHQKSGKVQFYMIIYDLRHYLKYFVLGCFYI